MIRHIVFFKFKESAEGRTRAENMEHVRGMLLALPPVIAQIRSMEVGFDVLRGETSYDMALVADFGSLEALSEYTVHPRHKAVSDYVAKVREARAAVDYEV